MTTGGYGKRTPLDQYSVKGRATMGIKTVDTHALDVIGLIAGARGGAKIGRPDHHLYQWPGAAYQGQGHQAG